MVANLIENLNMKFDPIEIVDTGHKRDYFGIVSIIITIIALLIIANEALGNPLLDYFTK